jgi:hypothetical protein
MEFLLQYLGIFITAIISGFIGWIFQRKKQNAELQSIEIDNAQKLLKYYTEMVNNLGGELAKAIKELNAAKQHNKELEIKIEELIEELKKYKQLNGKSIT